MSESKNEKVTPEMYATVQEHFNIEKGSLIALTEAVKSNLGWSEFRAAQADSDQMISALFMKMNENPERN